MSHTINVTLKVWRQNGPTDKGKFEKHNLENVSTEASFLEMIDVLNDKLEREGQEPFAIDHDCREGICGMCGLVINGKAHGGQLGTTTCQLHMRSFKDGDTINVTVLTKSEAAPPM